MKNWARNLQWDPSEVCHPNTEEEIKSIVLRAANTKSKIRLIGTGHSFSPLCQTNHITMTLDNYQGLISTDKQLCQATVKAGTKLNYLGELLFKEGMAMENLGDIDVQSIAGTISTGTHGTGKEFGTISTQVIALKFINGKGKIISCSKTNHPELFSAAQVSLGVLGVITEVTLQCIPIYKLELLNQKEPLDAVLSNLRERNSTNRNFEFYWFPYTTSTLTKTSNIVSDSDVDKMNFFNYWSEYFIENYSFKLLCEYARIFPSAKQRVSKICAASISSVKKILYSHKIYATQRLVKFTEMEYNIPADAYQDAWTEVQKIVNSGKYNIHFPIENRWAKGDDIMMSPSYGRDSAYIACHVYQNKDHKPYFTALEDVFKAYDGRPHWGKINTLNTSDIEERYPLFSEFLKHRQAQDPDGIFVSPYIEKLLGLENSVLVN